MANPEKQAFFEQYAPMAMEQQQKYGIPASVTLAQMYIESAGGKSKLAREGNNYFGIKCPPGWVASGKPYSLHNDDKPNERFCNYPSVSDSMTHHSQFLMQPRYAKCRQCASDDYIGWSRGLQAAGYATAGNYAQTIQSDIKAYGLDRYDRMAIEDARKKNISIGYMRGREEPFNHSLDRNKPLASNDNSLQTGHWSFPLAANGGEIVVTSGYGHRQTGIKGASTNHNGLDLRAQFVPILTTEDNGKVVNVSSDAKSGKWVKLEYERNDGSKYQVSYAHLSEINVKPGDIVNAGQPIGTSGASGLASAKGSAPHLHFVVRKVDVQGNSKYIDPTQYLAEIAVRGNISTKLVNKGDSNHQDLLTQYKAGFHSETSPVTQQTMSVQHDTKIESIDGISSATKNEQLITQLTQSEDPHDWLKYLMDKNNDHQVGSGDLITDLISVLFASVFTLAALDDHSTQEEEASQSEQQSVSAEIDRPTLIARKREGVDASKMRQMASMKFEANSSEEIQNQGVRLT